MMSAIENLEARKQAEDKPVEMKPVEIAEPQPTPPAPTNEASAQKKPTSATTTRSANPFTVALTLDEHVYHYFEKKAKEDDRTIAKYLARHLRATCPPEASGTKEKF